MQTCIKCHAEIQDGASFCPKCGAKQSADSVEPEAKVRRKFKLSKKVIIGLLAIIIAIVVVIVLIATNTLNSEEKVRVARTSKAISEIGEIENGSLEKIEKAEELFAALSGKEQRHVENRNELKEARVSYDMLRANEVDELIEKIGEIDLSSGSRLEGIRAKYEALSDDQKQFVTKTKEYTDALITYELLVIQDTEKLIAEIGTVSADDDTNARIEQARKAYDNLSDEQKEKISNYDILLHAEEDYEQACIEKCNELIASIRDVSIEDQEIISEAKVYYNALSEDAKSSVTNYATLETAISELRDIQKEAQRAEKMLSPGDSFTENNWELVYSGSNLADKIKPNNTSGYYLYYHPNDNEIYVDLVFQIQNVGNAMQSIENIVGDSTLLYGDKKMEISPTLYASYGGQIEPVYSWDGLSPLKQITLHIVYTLPREALSNDLPIEAEVKLCGKDKLIVVRGGEEE